MQNQDPTTDLSLRQRGTSKGETRGNTASKKALMRVWVFWAINCYVICQINFGFDVKLILKYSVNTTRRNEYSEKTWMATDSSDAPLIQLRGNKRSDETG